MTSASRSTAARRGASAAVRSMGRSRLRLDSTLTFPVCSGPCSKAACSRTAQSSCRTLRSSRPCGRRSQAPDGFRGRRTCCCRACAQSISLANCTMPASALCAVRGGVRGPEAPDREPAVRRVAFAFAATCGRRAAGVWRPSGGNGRPLAFAVATRLLKRRSSRRRRSPLAGTFRSVTGWSDPRRRQARCLTIRERQAATPLCGTMMADPDSGLRLKFSR